MLDMVSRFIYVPGDFDFNYSLVCQWKWMGACGFLNTQAEMACVKKSLISTLNIWITFFVGRN